jgi:micrococcal nuclease
MQFLLPLVLVAVGVAPMSPSIRRSESLLVRAVISGDTIDVVTVGRVRLLGIRAPAIERRLDGAAPLGGQARDRLAALVLNHWVRLERESRDGVGASWRTAYVMREDGVFVNAVMVREGLARVVAQFPLARLQELRDAEREAQSLRHGIWSLTPRTPASLGPRRAEAGSSIVTRKIHARYTAAVTNSSSRLRRRPGAAQTRSHSNFWGPIRS